MHDLCSCCNHSSGIKRPVDCARSRVLDTWILYSGLPSGGRDKMPERMQRTMDLLVRDSGVRHTC
jgi:hypothetical protein